ncbi:MAG: hypothetical protein BWY44_01125 [Candidatus Omnitrophica bacterium ADurb.Bin292]|jgi:hypothetical protein|nr:MAG: hypothetical protein BWY44_01125 [Candidatus Omnitrophica bacterium ADurb.Bin292]
MTFMKRITILFIFFIFCFQTLSVKAAGDSLDGHAVWRSFLHQFVNENGDVNYAGVKRNPALLNDYLAFIAAQNPVDVKTLWPREKAMAFWINAYHAGVIKIVVDHYPARSLNQISSAWDITVIHVGAEQYSLNQIRNQILMKTYRDEKIHLALSCGARGCPRLDRDPFTDANVEGKLFLATREFLNDPARVEIIPGKKTIRLSRIFKWYGADFNLDFGTPERIGKFSREEMSILSFLIYYSEDLQKIEFLEEGRYKIKYMPFDPELNDWIDAPPVSDHSLKYELPGEPK